MNKLDRCLLQIQAIRDVAAGIDPPYVARSRIGRLATSSVSLVAETFGIPDRQLPSQINVSNDMPGEVAERARCCNRIFQLSRHIRQPSEPLDDRWERGWDDLLGEIGTLEQHLQLLRARQPAVQ